MRHVPSNQDTIIDSRDIIKRIAELESSKASAKEGAEGLRAQIVELLPRERLSLDESAELTMCEQALWVDPEDGAEYQECSDWTEDDAIELRALLALQNECEGYSDWRHGETLIAKSYFVDYAQELAEDCGYIHQNTKWPYTHIDWDAAAEALSEDYAEVDFDGEPFYIRNC